MTESPTFLSPAPAPERVAYPLHLRNSVAADRDRLTELAAELGFEASAWSYLALEELARYRVAMHSYRRALIETGELGELPVWNYEIGASL